MMSKFNVGDVLVYFGPWKEANGYTCVVESIDTRDSRYFLKFTELRNPETDELESVYSKGEFCILESVYNSPLYKALR